LNNAEASQESIVGNGEQIRWITRRGHRRDGELQTGLATSIFNGAAAGITGDFFRRWINGDDNLTAAVTGSTLSARGGQTRSPEARE